MKKLIDALSEFYPISDKSKKQIFSILEYKKFKKNERLTSLGEVPTEFYILTSGVVRSYVTDEKGKEFTRSLYVPYGVAGAFSALIQEKPSEIIYDCLTDCDVLAGDYHKFKEFEKNNLELSLLYNKILEMVFIRMEKRIIELSVLDAKQRYLKLKKNIPEIENLIPQYHIASYLNITPVQLSRIRKDLYKN